MERMTEEAGLVELRREKSRFRNHIKLVYEPAAQDCGTCPTAGVCCTDAHFVNVHISRLEAVAIQGALGNVKLSETDRQSIYANAVEISERFTRSRNDDTFTRTYSCPLFMPGTGCLVHHGTKPAPCIHHACYENADDLPPESLLGRTELAIEQLNQAVYGEDCDWRPIPVWLAAMQPEMQRSNDVASSTRTDRAVTPSPITA